MITSKKNDIKGKKDRLVKERSYRLLKKFLREISYNGEHKPGSYEIYRTDQLIPKHESILFKFLSSNYIAHEVGLIIVEVWT